jgi:hypothetical protein
MLFNWLFTPHTEISGANPPPAVQGRKAEMKMHTRSRCYLIGCSPRHEISAANPPSRQLLLPSFFPLHLPAQLKKKKPCNHRSQGFFRMDEGLLLHEANGSLFGAEEVNTGLQGLYVESFA